MGAAFPNHFDGKDRDDVEKGILIISKAKGESHGKVPFAPFG